MYQELIKWRCSQPESTDGVIVGCDAEQEWMLTWWWMQYRLYNDYPVTFFNLGNLSIEAQDWCRRKGRLIDLTAVNDHFIAERQQVAEHHVAVWENHRDLDVWQARMAWFKKPLAFLNTPYQRTVWIDLECQVRGSIGEIFALCDNSLSIALAEEPLDVMELHREHGELKADQIDYNSGVVVFKHKCSLITDWAEACLELNEEFRGDQEVLRHLVYERGMLLPTLPPSYNTRPGSPEMATATIIHWVGVFKRYIRYQMQISDNLFIDLSFK